MGPARQVATDMLVGVVGGFVAMLFILAVTDIAWSWAPVLLGGLSLAVGSAVRILWTRSGSTRLS